MKSFSNYLTDHRIEEMAVFCSENGVDLAKMVETTIENAIAQEQDGTRRSELTQLYSEIWDWIGNQVGGAAKGFMGGFNRAYNGEPQQAAPGQQPPGAVPPVRTIPPEQQIQAIRQAYAILSQVELGQDFAQSLSQAVDKIRNTNAGPQAGNAGGVTPGGIIIPPTYGGPKTAATSAPAASPADPVQQAQQKLTKAQQELANATDPKEKAEIQKAVDAYTKELAAAQAKASSGAAAGGPPMNIAAWHVPEGEPIQENMMGRLRMLEQELVIAKRERNFEKIRMLESEIEMLRAKVGSREGDGIMPPDFFSRRQFAWYKPTGKAIQEVKSEVRPFMDWMRSKSA